MVGIATQSARLDDLAAAVHRAGHDLDRLTEDLVRFRTLRLTGEDYRACAQYLRRELRAAGIAATVVRVPAAEMAKVRAPGSHYRLLGLEGPIAPRYVVVGTLPSSRAGGRSLHLNGHFCVAEPPGRWRFDPFSPRRTAGRIGGRGTADMKGGIAAIVVALQAARAAAGDLAADVHVSLTVDTHLGGDLGAGYVAAEGLGRAERVIIADASGPETILLGYRGQLWAELETQGHRTHGSTPAFGHNAVLDMLVVLRHLEAHAAELAKRRSAWPILPESSRSPTLVVGSTISGGRCMNLVPDRCLATLDRRLIPEETPDEAYAELERVVALAREEQPAIDVRMRRVFAVPPTATPADHPLVETVARNVEAVTGVVPRRLVHPAFLDLQWFTTAWKAAGIVYGPGDGGLATEYRRKPFSEPNESVSRRDLRRATTVLARSIVDLTEAGAA